MKKFLLVQFCYATIALTILYFLPNIPKNTPFVYRSFSFIGMIWCWGKLYEFLEWTFDEQYSKPTIDFNMALQARLEEIKQRRMLEQQLEEEEYWHSRRPEQIKEDNI